MAYAKVTTDRRAILDVLVYHDFDVGVRVPRLISATTDGERITVVMPRFRPLPTQPPWLRIATDLARLHRSRPFACLTRRPWPAPATIAAGVTAWATIDPAAPARQAAAILSALGGESSADARHIVNGVAGGILGGDRAGIGRDDGIVCGDNAVVVHGDCHLGNLLQDDDGDLVWIDWLDMRLGTGAEDFALLWQRAEFDGLQPPRDHMVEAYLGSIDRPGLARALLTEELRLLLVDWPAFLRVAPSRSGPLADRLRQLVEQANL